MASVPVAIFVVLISYLDMHTTRPPCRNRLTRKWSGANTLGSTCRNVSLCLLRLGLQIGNSAFNGVIETWSWSPVWINVPHFVPNRLPTSRCSIQSYLLSKSRLRPFTAAFVLLNTTSVLRPW